MKKSYILISFTSSQNQTLKNLNTYLESISVDKSDIYIFTNTRDDILKDTFINIIRLDKVLSINDALKQFFKRGNKKILSEKMGSFISYDEIEIIFPHFLNILSNYFYHYCIPKMNHAKVIISIYPDGILSFQPYRINTLFQKEVLSRWTFSYFFGMPFKPFRGPISDPYSIVKKIYSYLPKSTIKYNSDQLIKISFAERSLKGDSLLILGHFNQSKFNEASLSNYVQNITTRFPKNSHDKVYYKRHPRLSKSKNDLFLNMLKLKASYNLNLIHDKKPIELAIEEVRAQTIIAAASSSLVNLKLKYNKSIDCYYFGLHHYVDSEYIKYYLNVFSELSINHLMLADER